MPATLRSSVVKGVIPGSSESFPQLYTLGGTVMIEQQERAIRQLLRRMVRISRKIYRRSLMRFCRTEGRKMHAARGGNDGKIARCRVQMLKGDERSGHCYRLN